MVAQFGEVRAGGAVRSEVREEQRVRAPRFDACAGSRPTPRDRCRAAASAAGRIRSSTILIPAVSPTNAMPVVGVEVADVMRRVARRVGHLELAAAVLDPLAACRAPSAPTAGTGRTSPHNRSIASPYSRVALASSFDGIDQVRRAPLVHVDAQPRVLADERAGRAGVIEVDVREQQRRHVAASTGRRPRARRAAPAACWTGPGSTIAAPPAPCRSAAATMRGRDWN